jgi:hypothetical protein
MAMMASNPWMVQAAGTALNVASKVSAGNAASKVGNRRADLADYEAKQLDYNAGQAIAASQRAAMEEQRNAALVSSRALAVAAASGGGASDPTIINALAKIAGEGQYRAMSDLYNGEDKARQLRMSAAGKRYQAGMERGDASSAQGASRFSAMTSALAGGASLYSKYFSNDEGSSDSFGAMGDFQGR